jgi:hypothetical protein
VEFLLLPPGDGLPGLAEPAFSPSLDLDEDEHVAIQGDDVDFTVLRAGTAFEDAVTPTLELSAGKPLAE